MNLRSSITFQWTELCLTSPPTHKSITIFIEYLLLGSVCCLPSQFYGIQTQSDMLIIESPQLHRFTNVLLNKWIIFNIFPLMYILKERITAIKLWFSSWFYMYSLIILVKHTIPIRIDVVLCSATWSPDRERTPVFKSLFTLSWSFSFGTSLCSSNEGIP